MPVRSLFGIGDVHGCYTLLLEIIDWIEAHAPDGAEIVYVGDIVDRGPDSKKVVEFLMAGPRRPQDEFVTIQGNHEAMLLKALRDGYFGDWRFWVANGGYQTAASYGCRANEPTKLPDDHLDWLAALPLYHESENHWFVHAGMHPGLHPDQHTPEHLLWMRDWEHFGHDRKYDKHVVFGHTPRKEVYQRPWCTGLDTGACFGYTLTAAQFDRYSPTGPVRLIQVDAKSGLLTVREPVFVQDSSEGEFDDAAG